ncbi:phosphomethylpyrimidine synthase, partial [Halobacterium salinarum]|nr:phosphomethylpyrimidine synthase [Halobacterium salinarum]
AGDDADDMTELTTETDLSESAAAEVNRPPTGTHDAPAAEQAPSPGDDDDD